MNGSNVQLEKFLRESGLVPEDKLGAAIQDAANDDSPLGLYLVQHELLSEDQLSRINAHIQGVPFVNLTQQKIDFEVLSLIPGPIAKSHNIVAYKKTEDALEVAMLDVHDLPVIDFIKKKVNLRILPRLTDKKSMQAVLSQYTKSLKAEFHDIISTETSTLSTASISPQDENDEAKLKEMAEDLPIVKIVDTLISHAILQKASDIHIEPGEKEVIVRYRIDGILHDAMTLPKNVAPGIVARIKVLSKLKLDEKRLPQDGRFKLASDDQNVSFRVSTLPTYYGEKTVIRILNENSYGFSLESLGFHGEGLERVHRAMKQTTGMILVSGPTGSGKTTTLYTILDILNTSEVNISTVEDPIEYQMSRINQTQVRSEIGLTFAAGLRSLLRQDPDIIMVGEIRDGETASLGVNAALTGHLVLSTIHTNSAAGVMPRLADMNIEPFLIASTVKTIVAQRLVRRLTKDKEQYTLSDAEYEQLVKVVNMDFLLSVLKEEEVVEQEATWKTIPFYRPKEGGVSEDGYKGRLGIHEILEMTSTLRDLIMENADAEKIDEQAKKEGMLTMIEDGIYWAVKGETSVEEVLRVVSE